MVKINLIQLMPILVPSLSTSKKSDSDRDTCHNVTFTAINTSYISKTCQHMPKLQCQFNQKGVSKKRTEQVPVNNYTHSPILSRLLTPRTSPPFYHTFHKFSLLSNKTNSKFLDSTFATTQMTKWTTEWTVGYSYMSVSILGSCCWFSHKQQEA